MIITVGEIEIELRINTYKANHDSGIEWVRIGNKWKSLDRGPETAHWSSEVTIKGEGSQVYDVRKAILENSIAGNSFEIQCEIYETIFGPEISYSLPFTCLVDDGDPSFSTQNLNTDIPTEWTFNVYPVGDLTQRYMYSGDSLPSSLHAQGANRQFGGAIALNELEVSRDASGFAHNAYLATVRYIGDRDDVGEAKVYLQKKRGSSFLLNNSLLSLFTPNVTSEVVFCNDIIDEGPIDSAGNEHSFSVVFAKDNRYTSTYSLSYLDESEVSMIVADSSDGIGAVQLHTVFSDGGDYAEICDWSVSNDTVAQVVNGLVSAKSGANGEDVVVSCSYNGVVKTCLVTVFSTLLSNSNLLLIKGGKTSIDSIVISSSFDSLKTLGGLESHMFSGISNRVTSGVGPVTRTAANESSFFDIGGSSGVVSISKCTYTGDNRNVQRFETSLSEIPVGVFPFVAFFDGSDFFINGVSKTISLVQTTSSVISGSILADFTSNRSQKLTIMSSGENGLLAADLQSPLTSRLFHCFQHYTRYTNRTVEGIARVNYTKIKNLGTLGNTYDLTANNVPSGWFLV